MPNYMIVTDAEITGADTVEFVQRGALPQTISGVAAGDWTVLNTASQGTVTVTSAAGGSTLQEITPTDYTGPTLTGTLPAAAGGFRTLTAADPAPIGCSIALNNTAYAVMAVRRSSFSGIIAMFSFNGGAYGNPPWFQVGVNGYTSNWIATVQNSDYTIVNSSQVIDGTWQIVEAWFDGTTLYMSIDGATPASIAIAGTGAITPTDLHMFRDEGSSGESVDLAAYRLLDTVPDATGRADARAWASALIPA